MRVSVWDDGANHTFRGGSFLIQELCMCLGSATACKPWSSPQDPTRSYNACACEYLCVCFATHQHQIISKALTYSGPRSDAKPLPVVQCPPHSPQDINTSIPQCLKCASREDHHRTPKHRLRPSFRPGRLRDHHRLWDQGGPSLDSRPLEVPP